MDDPENDNPEIKTLVAPFQSANIAGESQTEIDRLESVQKEREKTLTDLEKELKKKKQRI
jgi:septal ring factor EnvC (AmiA/AmiB activator)